MKTRIEQTFLEFVREPLVRPFGFKGGYVNDLWRTYCQIGLSDRTEGRGAGVQSVLWADSVTFSRHSQTGGNALMLAVTEKALSLLKGSGFVNPMKTLHEIFPACYAYAAQVTENSDLPATFVLNALVPVDFALWQAWAAREGVSSFSELTKRFCPSMSYHHEKLGIIPLISYNTPDEEVAELLNEGAFLLKIKIGSNPGGRDMPEERILQDIERVTRIHNIASRYRTPYTDCGYPVYYLDANGRYKSREELLRLLDGLAASGALDRIVLLEEPFPEDTALSVADLPVRVAGDESIHSREDAIRCMEELGYGAVALKPIAKTLSVTLEIYGEAAKRGIPCFCADLTVPPVMLEWNMQIAARIETIPGLKTGVVESNGAQNYRNWDKLLLETRRPDAGWLHPENGVFDLKDFYEECQVL